MVNGMSGYWLIRRLIRPSANPVSVLLRRCICPLALLLTAAVFSWGQFKRLPPDGPPNASLPTTPANPPAGGPQPELPQFSIKVNLVRLLVSARDATGAVVANLDKQDFHVADSGVPQEIAVFERNTSLPLSVAILIDTSGSTRIDLHYEVDSVLRFVPALLGAGNPEDVFAVFSFNWHTNLEVDYSRSQKRAARVLHALQGDGGTSLYDAVYLASDTLYGRPGRHVIVIVTDGGDTTSYKKYEDALAAAQHADASLYPVVVVPVAGDAGRNTGGEHALATLAASTGGRIFYPEGFTHLDQAFSQIIRDLRTQYLLGYYPKDVRLEPRRFHQVSVGARDNHIKVISRSGYYEPAS
jgi:Ca-activated chloride channel family protein